MSTAELNSKITDYWAGQKKSACPDDEARDLSIETIIRYLKPGTKVLDIGCGNGFCTYKFAETSIREVVGADYSDEMVKSALQGKTVYPAEIADKTSFERGDATQLQFKDGEFDAVVTVRCVINIPELEGKAKAIGEIARVIKSGGYYLMCENSLQGLQGLNRVRTDFGLSEIQMRWHNSYLDEKWINEVIQPYFILEKIDHFCSLYYLVSRVINAKLCALEGKEPQYGAPINKIARELAAKIPPVGEYAPMRLYVLRKK